ncbi:hypothetical protein ACLOJK_029748 [Asimina triloba]
MAANSEGTPVEPAEGTDIISGWDPIFKWGRVSSVERLCDDHIMRGASLLALMLRWVSNFYFLGGSALLEEKLMKEGNEA